ncbi:hypothetical protein P8452_38481 [Trifolium repens]|nr:hypothetical protein P8452_38481 [Trifolium repens]
MQSFQFNGDRDKMRHLLDSLEEDTIPSKIKKRRQCENENGEIKGSEDRLNLANVESLTVTSTTLQILSLVPNLLEVKLLSLSKVNITTNSPTSFNLKQIVESIKGAKYIEYPSRFTVPGSSSAAPASAAESASASSSATVPATAAPPNLHLCCAEKDDKSSNEDKVENYQPNTNSELLDNGQ